VCATAPTARQATRIVAVRVTAGDRIQPLAHEVCDHMPDLAALPPILDALDESRGEREASIGGLQQDRPTAGAPMRLVKLHHHRLAA
jgi:hypothetical protein